MATDNTQVIDDSFEADGDLSSSQYYFVALSGDNKVAVCDAADDLPIGVLQNKPTDGQTARVRIIGKTKIVSNDALTAGWTIGTSLDGQAERKVVTTDAAEYACGVVTLGTGATGDIGEAMINCATPHRAA